MSASGFHEHMIRFRSCDSSYQDAPVAWRPATDYTLMIRPAHEIGTQAARIYLFELLLLGRGNLNLPASPSFVHRLAIGACRQSHVIRVLISAFDLKRGHTNLEDFRNLFQCEKIAGRQKITSVTQRFQ